MSKENERLTDNEFHSKDKKERACYIQEPRLQAIYDKCFEYEDVDTNPTRLANIKKALEIIKRTHLNVGAFMLLCKGDHEYTPNTTYEQYICFCEKQGDILGDKIHSFPCYRMTGEEYELVLGVLYEKETS